MTITAPNRNRQLNYAIRWFFVGIIGCAVLSVGLYNTMVTVRRTVNEKMKLVETLKVENTQLKNTFYTILDTRTLTKAAERLGYVRDVNPSYITFLADGTTRQDGPTVSVRR
jgi:hypothetical protein